MTTLSTFTAYISPVAYQQAEKWSRRQATAEKSQQVLLNTLSVSFVNFYLECMGFETDLEASDSWNPIEQTLMDVADLLIKNIGKLECRPVLENSQFISVPPEVWRNRIGYVAVEISESLQSAKLLGFVEEVSTDNLPVNSLQNLESLLNHLEYLEVQKSQSSQKKIVSLIRWLEKIFESDWLPIESLFFTQPVWEFRSPEEKSKNFAERAKLITFGIEDNKASVGIVVKVNQELNNPNEIDILVELRPTHGQEYLPPSLQVMILDSEETAIMQAFSKNDNKKIELEFSASVGDAFSVKVVLADMTVIENFVI
ncbi:MAG: DUF1822 family protein [Aetokthonos hydrillicola CCALA 1050]|nr:DUF1822 family protein [Aetokthonos hydrillicola CCALA 1050]